MTDIKPEILTTVTRPEDMTLFFNALAKEGYTCKNFAISDQEGLLACAESLAEEGKPVAVLCSEVMTAFGYRDDVYNGERNGRELAEEIGKRVNGPTLTVIYSGDVSDNFNGLRAVGQHPVITVEKMGNVGDRGRIEPDHQIIAMSFDTFFANNAPR